MDRPLTALSDAELTDQLARETSHVGSWGYLVVVMEIARRESAKRERRMVWMTTAIVVLTLANVVAVAVSLLR